MSRAQNENSEATSAYPYITQLKPPRWLPFSFERQIPDTYIPRYDFFVQIMDKMSQFIMGNPSIEISTIFWYLTLKTYLKIPLIPKDDTIFTQILNYENIYNDKLGFSLKFAPKGKQSGKKGKGDEEPSVLATYFALASLNYLGKLQEYYETDSTLEKRERLSRYLDESRKNYNSESIFFWLCCSEMVEKASALYQREFLSHLKSTQEREKELFRLLCLHFLDIKSNVNQDQLLKFHHFEKPTGGYTLQNNAYANINETFWIGYTLTQYQWLLPQPTGTLFSYVVNELLKIKQEDARNESKITDMAQLIVLLVNIWNPLIENLELLIFEGISSQGVLDLNILSVRSGLRGAEDEILKYINLKYSFQLTIKDISVIYNQFLHDLDQDPYVQEFVRKLYDDAQKFAEFDISEIRQEYNKGKKKKNQITDEFLIKILQKMMDQHLFTGKIYPKSRGLFFTRYYFIRNSFVERIILSDRPISIETIKKEKRRLNVVLLDIYNYTREIESCAENTYREVESLIIAEDVDTAKERLRYNINNALMNASFFGKNIEGFQSEFSLINPKYALNPLIEKWNQAKRGLEHESSNLNTILMAKIGDLQEDQKQRKATLTLEELVNKNIDEIGDQIQVFNTQFRNDIATKYSRDNIHKLANYLQEILLRLDQMDVQIANQSKLIITKNEGIGKLRKKSIDRWVSQKDDFQKVIAFYQEGLKKWAEKVKHLDDLHHNFVSRSEDIEKKINLLLSKNQFDDALKINETEFTQIAEEINKIGVNLKSELEPLYKQSRKLISLYQKIPEEWNLLQNVLQKNIIRMREEFRKYIQRDLKLNIKEDFRINIENEMLGFRKEFQDFENTVSSLIMRDEPLGETQIVDDFKNLKQKFTINDVLIHQKYQEINPKIPEFANEMKKIIATWDQFIQQYQTEFNQVETRIEEELIIKGTLELSIQRSENVFSVQEIASSLRMEPIKVETKIKELIVADRINAFILPNSLNIEVHNEDWRKWDRLKQFKEVFLRELQSFSERVQQIFTKALENKNFIQNVPQLQSFIGLYAQKIQGAKKSYSQYVKDNNINLQHKLTQQTDVEFQEKIAQYDQEITAYTVKCNYAMEYQEFLDIQMKELNDLIHREIHNINQSLISRNMDNYQRNMKWFEEQKTILDTQIANIDTQIDKKKKDLWANIPNAEPIIAAIHQTIDERKTEYISFFENASSEIEKKLSQNEINKMGKEMESIINEKQDHLNQILYQTEMEVYHRIALKEFNIAAKHLILRKKVMDQEVKLIEKDIKAKNKLFMDRSKVFSIQNKFLIAQWNKFHEDFDLKVKEKIVLLENDIIESYLKYVVKSFKGQYILIRMVCDDLFMKHDDMIKRIVGLIGEGRLNGKIDIKNDIYYEAEQEIDKQTVASLEIINATNVKTYLTLNRLANIFKTIYPILAVIGVLISISSYLAQIFTNSLIIISPFFIIALLIAGVWLKKGKEKAIEHKII